MGKHQASLEGDRLMVKGLSTDEAHEITVESAGTFKLRLAMPSRMLQRIAQDRFTLQSSDGKFSQTLTLAEATAKGEDQVELSFSGLNKLKRYNLVTQPASGAGGAVIFENRAYADLEKIKV